MRVRAHTQRTIGQNSLIDPDSTTARWEYNFEISHFKIIKLSICDAYVIVKRQQKYDLKWEHMLHGFSLRKLKDT